MTLKNEVDERPVNRLGDQTFVFRSRPALKASWTIVGPKEKAGPLSRYFDEVFDDETLGMETSEKAEREIMKRAINGALMSCKACTQDIDVFIGGDLLNQIVSATFNARNCQVPYLGVYNACATFGEAVILGSVMIDGGFASSVMVGVASSYQTAERQYRYPIELNIQRKGTNQNTVSGSGVAVLSGNCDGIGIPMATIGRIVDLGEKDTNDMGCAMAPAAADTLLQHFRDTGRTPGDYDVILTGDLAAYGSKVFRDLVEVDGGFSLGGKHHDGGGMMYGNDPTYKAGASGCACSASVTLGFLVKEMKAGKYRRALVMPTGALHSPLTSQQGESIPCIAHAFVLENE